MIWNQWRNDDTVQIRNSTNGEMVWFPCSLRLCLCERATLWCHRMLLNWPLFWTGWASPGRVIVWRLFWRRPSKSQRFGSLKKLLFFFHINKAKIILQDVARACKQNGGSVEEERGYVWELGSQNPIDGSSSSQFKEKHVDPPSFLDNLSHVVGYMMKYTVIYRYIHLYSSYSSHTPIVSPVISLVGCVISNWWGIFSHGDLVVTLVWPEVDVDQSGSLDLREFILCMRKVREVELKAVKFLGSQMMDITGLFNEISPWNKGWTWFNHRHYGNRMEFLVVTCCNWELVRYPQIPSSKTVCHGKWAHGNKGQSSTTISFSMAMLNYQRVIEVDWFKGPCTVSFPFNSGPGLSGW